MRRYRISVVVGLALLYVLALSAHQPASAEVCPGSGHGNGHGGGSKGSTEVFFQVLPGPSTSANPSPGMTEECSGSGTDWDGGHYGSGDLPGSGGLPFTGPGHSVIFALESGVAAILLGTFLVLLSTRADRSRRRSRIAGR